MMNENYNDEEEIRLTYKDAIAIIFAMFQLLLPRILIMIISIIIGGCLIIKLLN